MNENPDKKKDEKSEINEKKNHEILIMDFFSTFFADCEEKEREKERT